MKLRLRHARGLTLEKRVHHPLINSSFDWSKISTWYYTIYIRIINKSKNTTKIIVYDNIYRWHDKSLMSYSSLIILHGNIFAIFGTLL